MKVIYVVALAMALVLGGGGAYASLTVNFEMGGDSSVDTSGTNDALIMYVNINTGLDALGFDLNPGESETFLFGFFGTDETWINRDDLVAGTIIASIDFDYPDVESPSISGTSIGFTGLLYYNQGWILTWDGPAVVDFGDGGLFTVELSDAYFVSDWWQGPDGSCQKTGADVFATVTLNAVPIPASIFLLGPGLLGLIWLRAKTRLKE